MAGRDVFQPDLRVLLTETITLQVDTTVAALPSAAVADILTLLAEFMPECPHLEFILKWLRALCIKHGPTLQVCIRTISAVEKHRVMMCP